MLDAFGAKQTIMPITLYCMKHTEHKLYNKLVYVKVDRIIIYK